MLLLQLDNPATGPSAAQQVAVQIGDQVITTIPLSSAPAQVLKYPVTAAQLGTARHGGDQVHGRQDVRAGAGSVDEERRSARARRAILPRVCSVIPMKTGPAASRCLELFVATDARADIVVFKNGRTMSAQSYKVDGEHGDHRAARRRGSDVSRVDRRARRSGRSARIRTEPGPGAGADVHRASPVTPSLTAAPALVPDEVLAARPFARSDFHRRRGAQRRCAAGARGDRAGVQLPGAGAIARRARGG